MLRAVTPIWAGLDRDDVVGVVVDEFQVDTLRGRLPPVAGLLGHKDGQTFEKVTEHFFFLFYNNVIEQVGDEFAGRSRILNGIEIGIFTQQMSKCDAVQRCQVSLVEVADMANYIGMNCVEIEWIYGSTLRR